MTLAQELFDAQLKLFAADSKLYDLVETLGLGEDGWEDWSYDHYDTSLELYGCPPELRLSDEAIAKVKEADFSIIWLNHKDGWETMYSLHRGAMYRTDCQRIKSPCAFAEKQLRRELKAKESQP